MPFSMVVSPIGQWFARFFSFNTLIIGSITIGVLCILTLVSYGIDRFFGRYESDTMVYEEISWFVSLAIAMLFLQATFMALNADIDSSQLGWQYSNAQFIILFYCLYIVHRKTVLWFNMGLPIYIYGLAIIKHQTQFNILNLLAMILLIAIIWIVYRNSDWSILKGIRTMTVSQVLLLTFEFMLMMTLVHFGNIEVQVMIKRYMKLEKDNGYDFLTGVRNRRTFNEVSNEVFEVYSNNDLPVAMAMFDIDHFKLFNDQYGHQVGDRVLKYVAQLFSDELFERKANAQLFRVGGEEFTITFRNRTATEAAPIVKEIRDILVKKTFEVKDDLDVRITVSIGVTDLKKSDQSAKDFYKRVDKYLYQAKNNSRNSMSVEGDVSSLS
ncbi:GGDEF domain-containing protein [Pediococcus acidilactici]